MTPARLTRSTRAALLLFLLAACPSARAEVVRFEITSREPVADGASLGDAGPYERIVGKVHYALDPHRRQNAPIVDLASARRNDQGKVEFSGDLFMLAPRDLSKGNGALLYDVNNRGNKLALRFFNDASGTNDPRTSAHLGNGFLMRQGFTVVWSGWVGELLPAADRLLLALPVATDGNQPITGLVRYAFSPTKDTTRVNINWDGHGAYRPTDEGLQSATLTWRLRAADPKVPVPRRQYQIHVTDVSSATPGQLPLVELEMPAGLKRAYIYELVYQARDPLVHGVGFAAVRDLISALKHGTAPGNPLAAEGEAAIKRAHGFGVSQSGRFLREFLYSGFNEDEQSRRVFDGLIPHVAGGGLGSFNHRFAQPAAYASQHEQSEALADRFPFTYGTQEDPLSGETDGILSRSIVSRTTPYVLHTQSSAEYWTRSGSLVHTDARGSRDAVIPDAVRIYAFGGTQHGRSDFPPDRGDGQNFANPGDYHPLLRALLVALDRWAAKGEPAPVGVYPNIGDRTLVDWTQTSTGFPPIPAVRYPEVIHRPPLLDLGPRWPGQRIIDVQPPRVAGHYRVLAEKCDADGNPRGCLLPAEVAVPLATFTGWNLRSREAGAENELVSLVGSYIPLPLTEAERQTSGDPRLSLEERYGTLEKYLRQLEDKCREMVRGRYLLEEDVDRILARQKQRAEPLFDRLAKRPANE